MTICKCITAKGTRCSREGHKKYGGFCWQHEPPKCKRQVEEGKKERKKKKKKTSDSKSKTKKTSSKRKTSSKKIATTSLSLPTSLSSSPPSKSPSPKLLPEIWSQHILSKTTPQTTIKTCKTLGAKVCDSNFWAYRVEKDFPMFRDLIKTPRDYERISIRYKKVKEIVDYSDKHDEFIRIDKKAPISSLDEREFYETEFGLTVTKNENIKLTLNKEGIPGKGGWSVSALGGPLLKRTKLINILTELVFLYPGTTLIIP